MSDKIHIQYYKSPFGELIIGAFDNKICLCDWKYRRMRTTIDKRIQSGIGAEYEEKSCEVIEDTIKQLNQYFDGERKAFELPLLLIGTDFQQEVWQKLQEIEYGKTESYLSLSHKISNEKAVRAVASANGANAISIMIPCHRIIGSDGKLVGYAGGLNAKKKLLALEQESPSQLEIF